ncbi:mechanosensitive ion channel family protein [Candidatus Woesearchaeota archaeon]|nr:mechanosensitive ion channel family protein [Candidatus Woesearchaeota archaeon]
MAYVDVLEYSLLGNTVREYILSLLILLGSFIVGKMFYSLSKNQIRKITAKTKTKFDDIFLEVVEKPLVALMVIFGFYFAMHVLVVNDLVWKVFWGIFVAAVTLDVAYFVLKFLDAMILEYIVPITERTESKLDDQLIPILRKTTKVIVIIMTVLVMLANFGYNITSILAGLGIGGLAFALAAQDTLGNMFGSFSIFADKPFHVKDHIIVAGYDGTVEEVGMRSTRIKTLEGTEVTIPNKLVANAGIENISRRAGRKIKTMIGLTYDTPAAKVEEAIATIQDVLKNTKGIKEESFVFLDDFGTHSLQIQFIYWIIYDVDFGKAMAVKNQVNLMVKQRMESAGITLTSPTQALPVKPSVPTLSAATPAEALPQKLKKN